MLLRPRYILNLLLPPTKCIVPYDRSFSVLSDHVGLRARFSPGGALSWQSTLRMDYRCDFSSLILDVTDPSTDSVMRYAHSDEMEDLRRRQETHNRLTTPGH